MTSTRLLAMKTVFHFPLPASLDRIKGITNALPSIFPDSQYQIILLFHSLYKFFIPVQMWNANQFNKFTYMIVNVQFATISGKASPRNLA